MEDHMRTSLNQLKLVLVLLGLFCLLLLNGCGGGGGGGGGSGSGGNSPSIAPVSDSSKELVLYKVNGIAANINQQTRQVSFILPYGSDLTNVDVEATTTGASVIIGGVTHEASTVKTSYDFTHSMPITVKARDGSTNDYTAVGAVAANTSREILSYSLRQFPNNAAIIDDQSGTISLTLPAGTVLSKWIANFETSGVSVTIGDSSDLQVSGETENDFSKGPMVYTVHAADGSTKDYTVVITIASAIDKDITSFSIGNSKGFIDEQSGTILLKLPFDAKLNSMIATFTTTGTFVTVGTDAQKQISGQTENDFSGAPVVYTVHAADGSTKTYTIKITIESNSSKDILKFGLVNVPGAPVTIDESGKKIFVTVPYGTDLSRLTAIFATTGSYVTVFDGIEDIKQDSGHTVNNFNNGSVTYTVHAADGSTKDYSVTVQPSLNTAKEITSFLIKEFPDAPVTIDQLNKKISVIVPYSTDLDTPLIADFTTTGEFVTVFVDKEDKKQVSKSTKNIFKTPLVYTVHAADGSTNAYTVTITPALNSAKEITHYLISGYEEAPVTIDEQNRSIFVTLPYGTDISKPLVAIFSTTGNKITDKNGVLQVSEETENKFNTGPVTYVVTAQDGSTKEYNVTVVVAKNNQKEISTYSIYGIPGSFNGDNITVALPFAADITNLTATFSYVGKSIEIIRNGIRYPQQSKETANNFESSVEYTVTADDDSIHIYHVTVKFNLWTWNFGSSKINQASIVDISNNGTPGGRGSAATWTDAQGFFWMFGGSVSSDFYNTQVLSDLWIGLPDSQNPGKIQWVLKSDPKQVNTRNSYGTYPPATGKTGNPGARLGPVTWRDNNGTLWMYGGYGFAASTSGMLNDLWRLDYTGQGGTANAAWTWVGGSNQANAKPQYISRGVEGGMPGARRYAASWSDAQGNLWLFGGATLTNPADPRSLEFYNDLWKYNIASDKWTWMKGDNITNQSGYVSTDPANSGPGARSQAVTWVDQDGNLWLFGGYMYIKNTTGRNLMYNDLWKYNPATNRWAFVKGTIDFQGIVQTQQSGVYNSVGIGNDKTTPGGRRASTSWIDNEGNLWLFGGEGISSDANLYYLNDLWRFSIADSKWTWMSGREFNGQSYVDHRFTFYGTMGTGSFLTGPGSRDHLQSWADKNGNLIMFGGLGYGATTNDFGFLNDYWVYNYK
ncbi:MAG: xynA1 3 [Burkholderiales bacterium]|jgi:hypothetical protein|nr:xynA1 3 [Burkholderiales bacterium]